MEWQMNGGDGQGLAPRKENKGEKEADLVGDGGAAEGEMTEMDGTVREARAEEVVEQVKK